jgi:hypothetical protein
VHRQPFHVLAHDPPLARAAAVTGLNAARTWTERYLCGSLPLLRT